MNVEKMSLQCCSWISTNPIQETISGWCYKIICLGNLRSISIKKTNQSHLFRCSFNVSSFIVFSWVHNNLSSIPKEEGEELEETEDEEELQEEGNKSEIQDNEPPPTT